MGTNANAVKAAQLGIPVGTARNRLVKLIMFDMMHRLDEDKCFRCGVSIESVEDLSIEHKIPWLHGENPIGDYYDLDNIAFSHLDCNVSSRRHPAPSHGNQRMYVKYGCRCEECRSGNSSRVRKYRARNRQLVVSAGSL